MVSLVGMVSQYGLWIKIGDPSIFNSSTYKVTLEIQKCPSGIADCGPVSQIVVRASARGPWPELG